jgi:hypothetical protein
VDPTRRREIGGRRDDAEQREGDGRRQSEPDPGDEAAEHAGLTGPDGDAELAARRPGEELAQRHEIGEGVLVEPPPPSHVLVAEVPEVGDRASERRQPEAERRHEDVTPRPAPGSTIAAHVDRLSA